MKVFGKMKVIPIPISFGKLVVKIAKALKELKIQ